MEHAERSSLEPISGVVLVPRGQTRKAAMGVPGKVSELSASASRHLAAISPDSFLPGTGTSGRQMEAGTVLPEPHGHQLRSPRTDMWAAFLAPPGGHQCGFLSSRKQLL